MNFKELVQLGMLVLGFIGMAVLLSMFAVAGILVIIKHLG